MNLNDVSIFVQVVDQRGFAAAGRKLRIPKSTLSKRVAELERSLGVRLIERTSRNFVVTPVGEAFYRHASAMLIEAEAAKAVVAGQLAEPQGVVRLTASIPTAQLVLAPHLPELAVAWPKLTLVLHASDRFVDVLQEGYDIALRDHFGPLPNSGLVQRRLAFDASQLVAAPSYLKRCGTPESPEDLDAHAGLCVGPSETVWSLRDEVTGRTSDVVPIARFFADEATVLLRAAAAGLGIACLPSKLCQAHLDDGSLVPVLRRWTGGGVTTSLLMPPRRAQLPAVRAVADFLVERLSS